MPTWRRKWPLWLLIYLPSLERLSRHVSSKKQVHSPLWLSAPPPLCRFSERRRLFSGTHSKLMPSLLLLIYLFGLLLSFCRALKTKGNTPKYGIIYHSSFIGRASAKNKGRISRYLANKCSIASRVDSFIDEPTNAYGLQLREQVTVSIST